MASPSGQPQNPENGSQSLSSRDETTEGSMSSRSHTTKVVSIAEPESISPTQVEKQKDLDKCDSPELDKAAKQFRANVSGKRLSGRPSIERLGSAAKQSLASNPSLSSLISEDPDMSSTSPKHRHAHEKLVNQIQAWLKHEKERRSARRAKRKTASKDRKAERRHHEATGSEDADGSSPTGERRDSMSSEGSVALENLANILERTMSLKSTEGSSRKRRSSHKLSSLMKRHSVVSSDTDYFESLDQLVPSCDAVLDNSRTLAYTGGDDGAIPSKDKEAWSTFKHEIVRLAHTLKLKGWRRVPLENSGDIEVERLSGALTNAVYVVCPPKELSSQGDTGGTFPAPKNPPPKLLLRIYGPQVEHLIDRESELQILRRLARKRIGPRLLGTFSNGRFEEFFHAKTLTFQDLRIPDTSKQIAKRMRELHEGIDLLPKERDDGPFVWRNWDKWVQRCELIVGWLDQQVLEASQSSSVPPCDAWKKRGYVCGLQWHFFRQTIEKYRKWLEDQYGGRENVNDRLVFAHNDTQYGNILRLIPAGESPLLLPANEHKQLVVIDFEYANANLPGLEFANHFTEWCYNYHDPDYSFRCNTSYYPTTEEQSRFIRAYLMHNPTFKEAGRTSNPPTPSFGPLPTSGSTTALAATTTPTTISAFMLDSRAPPGEKYSYQEREAQAEEDIETETTRLMAETRLWRLANSAQWVAWGIVQANVPGCPDFQKDQETENEKGNDTSSKQGELLESATTELRAEAAAESAKPDDSEAGKQPEEGEDDEPEDEFDYLAYARERAMFFWGDAIRLGIVKAEDLPEDVRKGVKLVEF